MYLWLTNLTVLLFGAAVQGPAHTIEILEMNFENLGTNVQKLLLDVSARKLVLFSQPPSAVLRAKYFGKRQRIEFWSSFVLAVG